VVWNVVPILSSFVLSFTDFTTGRIDIERINWVGWHNYTLAFTDPVFKKSMVNTLIYAAIGIPVRNMLALFIAQLLYSAKRSRAFFRLIAFLPVMSPPLATVILFKFFYHFKYGPFNYALGLVGIPRVPWLSDTLWSKPSVIIMTVWNLIGYTIIVLLGGLGTIPDTLREAAKIDGANSWQSFWRVTWPLMRRSVAFVFVTDGIFWLQLFDQPYVLTTKGQVPGGPANSTLTALMMVHRVGLQDYRGGAASALAFVLFIVIFILTVVQYRLLRTKWEY
jgi:multiple sugar transport system permease protein